jgi:RNA recognition motif-containing protein
VIVDRDSGRSRGFGSVEMESDAAARDAINAIDGNEVEGRRLKVNEARERQSRGRRP